LTGFEENPQVFNIRRWLLGTSAWVGIIAGLLGLVPTVLAIMEGGAGFLHLAWQASFFVLVLLGSVGVLMRCER
jgi:hypothetical protein